jgi:phage terminase large subunit-like protein
LTNFARHPRRKALETKLSDDEVSDIACDWRDLWARDDQKIFAGPWQTLLMLGGRGAGKTRAGAEWVRGIACGLWPDWGPPRTRIALVGPTLNEARSVMVEGVSGLLAVHDDDWRPKYEPSKRLITWPNGAVAQIYSAEDPDSLRGPQFDAAWCDEMAKWKHPDAAWDMLQFGLRLGERPCVVATTTPRPIPLVKRLVADPLTEARSAPTAANAAHLAKSFLAEMERRYRGTKLGRQELDAEVIGDDPDALFKRDWIESRRVKDAPGLVRIVVAVDPPAGKGSRSNACGIVCAGLGADGRCYVLDDQTAKGLSPARWAAKAIGLFHARRADRIVAEVNQGGAMVEQVLREVDATVPYRAVHATRGKAVRAEPVAALYEQGKVSHAGGFAALEDEMCSMIGAGASPDRLDALVWAVWELMLRPGSAGPRVWVG